MKIEYTLALTVAALLSVSTAQDAAAAGAFSDTDGNAIIASPVDATGADADFVAVSTDTSTDDADRSVDDITAADDTTDDDANFVNTSVDDDDDNVGADADAANDDRSDDPAVNDDGTVAPAAPATTSPAPSTPAPTATTAPFNYPLARQQVIMGVNKARQSAGLAQICLSAKLMSAAQSQASFQATTNSVTVTGENGSQPSDRGLKAGFNATAGVAELVGAGYATPDELIAAWFASESSKAIVLGNYTHIGPGITVDTKQQYVYYWAIDFASGVGEACSGLAA